MVKCVTAGIAVVWHFSVVVPLEQPKKMLSLLGLKGREVMEAGRIWYVRRADIWELVKLRKVGGNIGFKRGNCL